MLASPLGAVTQERLVTVKTADVKATYDFATSDEFIAAALNKIESAVFQGGVKVTIKNFDKEVELSEDHLNVIATDWDTAAKKLNRDLAMFGYAPVRPIRHPSRPKEFLFHVPPWSKYELQFVESSQAPRRYFVHYLDATYPAATLAELLDTDGAGPPKRTKTLANPVSVFDASIVQMQANENNVGYPLVGGGRSHLIFVRWHPTVDGFLQSPVALLRRRMTGLSQATDDEAYASFWRARPLHVVGISKNFFGGGGGGGGTTGKESFGPGMFAEGDVKGEQDKHRFDRNEAEYIDFRLALQAASEGRMLTSKDGENARKALNSLMSATHHIQPDNPNSAVPPSDYHNIVLGANQALSQGPKPEGHPNFEKMREMVMDLAFAILNIQPAVVTPQRAKFSADPQTTLREWDSALQAVQQQLGPMLAQIYEVAYSQSTSDHVNAVYQLFKSEAEKYEDQLEEEKKQNPTFGGVPSRREFEALLKKNGQDDLLKNLKHDRKRTAKQAIANGLRVSFSFNHVPRNTLQELKVLQMDLVISDDTYVLMAGRLAGISREDILADEKDREKERQKRLKTRATEMETELKLKSKYAPQKGGGGGGGALGGFGQKPAAPGGAPKKPAAPKGM